jgi:hypothetical protein
MRAWEDVHVFADLVIPRWGKCAAGQMLTALRPAQDPALAVIDLSGTSWVEPVGLVGVAAFAEAQVALNRTVSLIGPSDWNIANYVARMHLGQVIDDLGGTHDLNPVNERDAPDLLELQRFEGEDGATQLAALVFDKTVNDEPVAQALYQSICEIGANVPQHSGRPHGYIAAATTYRGKKIQFAVGDAGTGLTTRLSAVGSTGDADSLEMVLEHGVSSTGQPGRGRGIQETRRLVTSLKGSVHMVSGTASRTVVASTSTSTSKNIPFPGTLLQGSLECP